MSILRKDVNKILIKIKKGDEKSKNVLYEMTYNHLKIIAYPCVYNKAYVEDVVIEAYLRSFEYIGSFNPKRDGYNWMCKIVENVARDYNKEYVQEVSLEEVEQSNQTIELEEMIAVRDEVQRLLQPYSERDRKLIDLRFFENRTIEDIAQLLGMGKSNVHKRISKIIKEILQKEEKRVEK